MSSHIEMRRFVASLVEEDPQLKVCYIAILKDSETGYYDLEVESEPFATIAGTFGTDARTVEAARSEADVLEEELVRKGVRVIKDRVEWESMDPNAQ